MKSANALSLSATDSGRRKRLMIGMEFSLVSLMRPRRQLSMRRRMKKIGPDDVPASLSPSLSRSLSVPLFHQNITGLYGVTNSLWLLPRWRKTGVRIAAGAVRFIMPRLEVSWTVSNLEDTSLAREIHDALAVIRETIHASCPARMPQSLNRKMEGI
jgi:hypothetical protein